MKIVIDIQRGGVGHAGRLLELLHRRAADIFDGAEKAHQLLGATIVGFIAFLPVYLSQDMSGEYCRDLFLVLTISLIISWLVAMLRMLLFV